MSLHAFLGLTAVFAVYQVVRRRPDAAVVMAALTFIVAWLLT